MRPAALLACLATAFPAMAETGADPFAAALSDAVPIAIEAEPIDVPATLHRSAAPLGAWHLTADHPAFGGISGLLIEDGAGDGTGDGAGDARLLAVTDQAHWIGARIGLEAGALRLSEGRIAPVLNHLGEGFDKTAGDAEGLARQGSEIWVAFEHDHRIERSLGGGRVGQGTAARVWESLAANNGLEGLAALPDGALLAIAEGPDAAGFPMWRLEPGGTLSENRLPRRSEHVVTGADLGPDGKLYVVQRSYAPLTGVSIRLLAYWMGEDGWPDPGRVTEIAAWESESGIDNMEAVAVVAGADGPVAWLIADDNFNPPQRTILVALRLGQ